MGGGETVCTMQLISSLETVRRTKEMHCLIMPVESRLWFGADGCGIEGGVLGGGGEGGLTEAAAAALQVDIQVSRRRRRSCFRCLG